MRLEPAPHHVHIIEHLEKIDSGALRRLLISSAPGSAKSTYASVLFPAWYLSRHPDHQFICASHTVELAEKHARRARDLIMEHSTVLGVELADDSQSAGRWSLKSGGSVFAVGAGGAVVGQRADAVLIDDPQRGREEAHSESAREKLYEWYVSDLLTRLRPGGRICLISTRWHEDDLFGRLAQSGRYGIINLPAVAEDVDDPLGRKPGEYLWDTDPNYPFGEFLRAQRELQLPSNWSALFQGRPAPEFGDFFRAEFFKPLSVMPARETLHIYGASDYAVSSGRDDFTVHLVVGLDPDGTLYLLDCWRKQSATDESVEAFCDLVSCGNPSAGPRRRASWPTPSSLSWSPGSARATRMSQWNCFQPKATRPCAVKASAVDSRSAAACWSLSKLSGGRKFGQRLSASPIQGTMIFVIVWGSSDKF